MSNPMKSSECIYPECGPTCRKDCPPLPTKPEPIEPTEAQRRAATGIVLACLSGANNAASVFVVARLLAEREAKLQARIDDLTEELAATDTTEMRLRAERDTLRAELEHFRRRLVETDTEASEARARVAELEASVKQKNAHIEEMEENANRVGAVIKIFMDYEDTSQRREATYLARIAELEAERFAAVSSDGYIATGTGPVHVDDVGSVRDALEVREAQHLADIKALMAKRLADMLEAARWGAELAFNVDEHVDDTKIAADIMEEFAKFDAEDELLARLAHYDDAKADAPASTPDCPRESPECITAGFHAVDECERRPTSFPAECPKCQEGTHPFYDVEQARWLCDRCHHPAGEPFVHVDDDHKNGPCGWSGCGRCGDAEGGEG